MTEEWKAIAGYEGSYEVSNLGQVRSLDRVNGRGFNIFGKVLEPNPDVKGYLGVGLYSGHRASRRRRLIHQLVAEAFIGPRPDGYDVCHNDGNNQNNKPENLRYDTRSANILDAVRHGTQYTSSRVTCKRGHTLGAYDGNREKGCRACTRALATVKYHTDLTPYVDQIADIHYKNMTGPNKRILRSDIESMLE